METQMHVTDKIDRAVADNNKKEGETTKKIEKITAAIPSATWLLLGGGSIVLSMSLKLMGRGNAANFVGQWAPTFLMLGLYNKVVKVMGSDRGDANGAKA